MMHWRNCISIIGYLGFSIFRMRFWRIYMLLRRGGLRTKMSDFSKKYLSIFYVLLNK